MKHCCETPEVDILFSLGHNSDGCGWRPALCALGQGTDLQGSRVIAVEHFVMESVVLRKECSQLPTSDHGLLLAL